MEKYNDSHQTQLAAACVLLSIADADEVLEENELVIIHEILHEFFSLEQNTVQSLMDEATKTLKISADLFQFGVQLNKNLSHDDKLDFINCLFEVAYADGKLHYLEHHTVKKISNILNLHRDDIIAAKAEIESYMD